MPGRLYLVPTPIGHLEDITRRAVRILGEVDYIACEDTRHSAILLTHLGIKKRTVSFYRPREIEQGKRIIQSLLQGSHVALISDAGSPALADPGEVLVRMALEQGITVEALPGPTALIPALTASGFATSPFLFMGFPPRKIGELRAYLQAAGPFLGTVVFYESPLRIATLCQRLHDLWGEQRAVAFKEISKHFESRLVGTLATLANRLGTEEQKGEWVLLVSKQTSLAKVPLKLETLDDLYQYFKEHHGLNKNAVKNLIQRRNKSDL